MVMIKDDEIIGYFIDQECVCLGCIEPGEKEGLVLENLITEHDAENEGWCFCDRCGKKIY